jgi:16S rRNA (adenine1518-N6/adenine1519-N6)-dimethyltransferase
MSAIDDLPPLREVIRRHQLTPRKSLGQNFLLDLNLTARIARAGGTPAHVPAKWEPVRRQEHAPKDNSGAPPVPAGTGGALEGVTVVEIGPGPGGLTRALLAEGAARVIAVERDERAIAALDEIAAHYPGRLTIVAGDALDFDARPHLADGPVRIIANLPYNIATALLVRWLSVEPWPPWFESLVLMFQREVAERIVAPPGSKTFGRLSVLAGWRTEAKILFDVSASAFVPPPRVTSSVVRLVPRPAPLPCERRMLERVTEAAFGQRRKMLRQSLKSLGGDPRALLASAGIAETARAEDIPVAGFAALARALAESGGSPG